MKKVSIYTDGACSGNPGMGGWAAILMYRSVRKEISGNALETTNNRMEITAALEGLEALKEPCAVDIYTDSAYLYNAFHEGWIYNWIRNGFVKTNKKPVENRDLWERMIELTRKHKVNWNKVKGHADNEYNNRCDQLARAEIKKLRETVDPKPLEGLEAQEPLK
ncbi:MAG: ribonuclease HI [Clostridiales bacterium]|nr:ribonuclease HI [Clostridiales bacterium]